MVASQCLSSYNPVSNQLQPLDHGLDLKCLTSYIIVSNYFQPCVQLDTTLCLISYNFVSIQLRPLIKVSNQLHPRVYDIQLHGSQIRSIVTSVCLVTRPLSFFLIHLEQFVQSVCVPLLNWFRHKEKAFQKRKCSIFLHLQKTVFTVSQKKSPQRQKVIIPFFSLSLSILVLSSLSLLFRVFLSFSS